MENIESVLVVDGLTKKYPGRTALLNVNFSVKKGSIHGFLGPNGAGKSTTMRIIAGLTPSTSGSVFVLGEKVIPQHLKLKNMVGFLPENPPLYDEMSVEKYLYFVAHLHRVKNVSDQVTKLMDELSLGGVRKRLIGNLSKGYKQRVGLAQALIYDAPFLILDEPTNGLDPQTVVELRDFIKRLSREKTILFSSHVLPEVEELCDQMTIIHQGVIRATGDIHQIHQKFKQGLVLRIGLSLNQTLPDLSRFGKYQVSTDAIIGEERQYHLVFESDHDCRGEIGKFIISQNLSLLTLQMESPELEDIFLQLTEKSK